MGVGFFSDGRATSGLHDLSEWLTWWDEDAGRPCATTWVFTRQTFDDAGRIKSTTDANENTTLFGFDTVYGYPNQATHPIGSMTTQTVLRAGDGLPSTTIDQNDLVTHYCYDTLSRLTAVYAPLNTGTRPDNPCNTYPGFTGTTGEGDCQNVCVNGRGGHVSGRR